MTAERSVPSRMSGLAIASFSLSILSIILWPFGFVPGIICGHLARAELKRNADMGGEGLALAGLIIGYVFAAFTVLALLAFVAWALLVEAPFPGPTSY